MGRNNNRRKQPSAQPGDPSDLYNYTGDGRLDRPTDDRLRRLRVYDNSRNAVEGCHVRNYTLQEALDYFDKQAADAKADAAAPVASQPVDEASSSLSANPPAPLSSGKGKGNLQRVPPLAPLQQRGPSSAPGEAVAKDRDIKSASRTTVTAEPSFEQTGCAVEDMTAGGEALVVGWNDPNERRRIELVKALRDGLERCAQNSAEHGLSPVDPAIRHVLASLDDRLQRVCQFLTDQHQFTMGTALQAAVDKILGDVQTNNLGISYCNKTTVDQKKLLAALEPALKEWRTEGEKLGREMHERFVAEFKAQMDVLRARCIALVRDVEETLITDFDALREWAHATLQSIAQATNQIGEIWTHEKENIRELQTQVEQQQEQIEQQQAQIEQQKREMATLYDRIVEQQDDLKKQQQKQQHDFDNTRRFLQLVLDQQARLGSNARPGSSAGSKTSAGPS